MNIVVKTACIRPAQALAIKASPLPNNWHSFLSKNKCSGCRYLLSSFLFYLLKKAQHKKNTGIIPPVWVAFSSSPAEERGWIPLTSTALAEGSSGAAWQEKVVPCCWQMVPSLGLRNENYFPENIWHCGSLVWNQLGRGQGPRCLLAMSTLAHWKHPSSYSEMVLSPEHSLLWYHYWLSSTNYCTT